MPNVKSGKTGKPTSTRVQPHVNAAQQDNDPVEEWMEHAEQDDDISRTPTPTDAADDDDHEDENDTESSSAFSLQECINEFRARRVRRISTHSRDMVEGCVRDVECGTRRGTAKEFVHAPPADADLIDQNRSNKEQERKCKPCQNGFCYCFTSDSGDGGGCTATATTGTARVAHVRQSRRSRRSESAQVSHIGSQNRNVVKPKEMHRQSASANFKAPVKSNTLRKNGKALASVSTAFDPRSLTAISRLQSAESADAPLIQIIQELHNNCVISEVRVNKHKVNEIQGRHQRSNAKKHIEPQSESRRSSSPRKKTQFQIDDVAKPPSPAKARLIPLKQSSPLAPPLSRISESSSDRPQLSSSPLDVNSSGSSGRKRPKAAGRLLHKRLGYAKPNPAKPPPKPPRSAAVLEDQFTVSSLASTTPSLRDAERIIDEFLKRRGYVVPTTATKHEQAHSTSLTTRTQRGVADMSTQYEPDLVEEQAWHRGQRNSYPLTQTENKSHFRKPLPSCPSLSDIERDAESKKKHSHYEKNICHASEKQVKELHFGWAEPKINDMLNCGTNINGKDFRSRSAQAEPQAIGWQAPPKVDLDTVDGGLRGNLATNVDPKGTPVKPRFFSAHKQRPNDSQRFIWGERLSSLSPWSNKCSPPDQKSSLKATSRSFLKSSKKKILRLVSPKKDNKLRRSFEVRKTPLRLHSVGVQTSHVDERSYEPSSMPQSPPGSYHSAVQTSQQSTTLSRTPTSNDTTHGERSQKEKHFDFTRHVLTPPKKAPRSSQRKLNFPASSGQAARNTGGGDGPSASTMTKTYRSFQSDLDQDVTISKMGDILRNIRVKLEASDERAIRTFKEVERRERQAAGFDCPDGQRHIRAETTVDIHRNTPPRSDEFGSYNDPIYSEIEEDSLHILVRPQVDNKTGSGQVSSNQHACDPSAIYAKVNKAPRQQTAPSPTALGKLLHDSLKRLDPILPPMPPIPEPENSDRLYAIPPEIFGASTKGSKLAHCQSLNNIRVMEQHSPPKRNHNLSKSDLSLHRSDIFLENLCSTEIIVADKAPPKRLEKVNNDVLNDFRMFEEQLQVTPALNDSVVSYASPDEVDADVDTAGSHLRLGGISPPSAHNHSTPRPGAPDETRTYMTQPFAENEMPLQVSIDLGDGDKECSRSLLSQNQSQSCPTTPQHLPLPTPDTDHQNKAQAASLDDVYTHKKYKRTHSQERGSHSRYKWLKSTLQKSFRKSKKFLKCESRRLSCSLPLKSGHSGGSKGADSTQCDLSASCSEMAASFNLDEVLGQSDTEPIAHQLVKVVSICRQLPELEISTEMVEAERLLLFSVLCRQSDRQQRQPLQSGVLAEPARRFYIDAMRLPVRPDVHQDLFFNMFYICTFECDGIIRSTQSVECHAGEALFRDCGIELVCNSTSLDTDTEVRCAIFMLRLRKVSTLSLEPPRKPLVKLPNLFDVSADSSVGSCDEIVSRFRLHASFTLRASSFAPYEYVECVSKQSDILCVRASTICSIPLSPRTKTTNLSCAVELTGRAEMRCTKRKHSGFLNVQDPHSLHNWNRRWCMLDGLQLSVWQDTNDTITQPLLCLDLCDSLQATPLGAAPPELCARPRSFLLQCTVRKADEEVDTAAVFFTAETQSDLANWLEHLNTVLDFIRTWMR